MPRLAIYLRLKNCLNPCRKVYTTVIDAYGKTGNLLKAIDKFKA
jgi:pentatricopeptide repeat protein